MTSHTNMLNTLRASGHRVTLQRQLVLEILENSPKHLDAEAIYQQAHQKDPRISLATVYRNLTVLKEMELIEQRYITRDHTREHYEPIGVPEHHHFTCLSCQKVIEFQSARVKEMQAELQHELGLEISHVCICLEGYCQSCVELRQAVLAE